MAVKAKNKPSAVVVGPNFLNSWFVYDFQFCAECEKLKETLDYINRHGYDLITVTQDRQGVYTVFFRRRACG